MVIAKNGLEAIAMAKAHHPELILMVQIPEMDGLAWMVWRSRKIFNRANEYLPKP
ncbi:hypothetical protein APA_4309 [Pseudanabaena sp. lw0831]|uniref:hypothetical protein n=1 Tax=Pseudanabaena sp. lw0831 TaxID=1357935 RepID=UPI00191587B6|nr:hypothetical protein [Pseudanabaena sp. lw0831]GBO56104.1 hypothetical protein APA_4309 [Pseudanabaena sp. lw0831]